MLKLLMFKRNFPVFVNFPIIVPAVRRESRGIEVAKLAMRSGR